MNAKAYTPDEKFIIQLYRVAVAAGDSYVPVSWQEVAFPIGQKESGVKNIIKLLAQANFIKKCEDGKIALTPHGRAFVCAELKNSC